VDVTRIDFVEVSPKCPFILGKTGVPCPFLKETGAPVDVVVAVGFDVCDDQSSVTRPEKSLMFSIGVPTFLGILSITSDGREEAPA
jgi:hypothetical protein